MAGWWGCWRSRSRPTDDWTVGSTETPVALAAHMVIIGVGQCGAPRLSIPRGIALKDALVVEGATISEWEDA